MSLDRLRTFLEVYRERSMGRAATTLGLTQPGVSAQIKALEHELGAPLFERSRSGVVPTAVAESLASDVAGSLDTLAQSMAGRLARTQTISGLLHLGAPPEMFSHYGPRLLSSLINTAIRIHVHLGGRSFLYESLEDGTLDLAFTASKPNDRSFGYQTMGEENLWLVGHPDISKATAGRKDRFSALKTSPLICYDDDLSLLKTWQAQTKIAFETPKPSVLVGDLRSVCTVTHSFRGWAVLPSYLVESVIEKGDLVRLANETVSNTFYLVWKRSNLRTPRVSYAKERFSEIAFSTT